MATWGDVAVVPLLLAKAQLALFWHIAAEALKIIEGNKGERRKRKQRRGARLFKGERKR